QCSLFLPATGRGRSACVEAKRTADTLEMHGQREVFHQCDWREAPRGIESGTSDKPGLITRSDPGSSRKTGHPGGDQAQQSTTIKLHVESPPDTTRTRKAIKYERVRIIWQPSVRMQEQKNVATRSYAPCIHLQGASARCNAHVISERTGAGRCAISASPVHNDQLNTTLSIGRKRYERRFDICSLVQHRHDDRQPLAAHSAASSNAPPQLEPCPAVQP